MSTRLPTPVCYNCDHYCHKVEKRGDSLESRRWCELTGQKINSSMQACPLHQYAPRWRLKGAKNATQQTRYPET